MTPWQEQQAAMLDAIPRQHAEPAKRAWLELRDKLFAELAGERKTKRQVLDSLRRKYGWSGRPSWRAGWCRGEALDRPRRSAP